MTVQRKQDENCGYLSENEMGEVLGIVSWLDGNRSSIVGVEVVLTDSNGEPIGTVKIVGDTAAFVPAGWSGDA